MYRINPLQRNVLITTDEVIFHASTEHTLDPRTIQQAIIIAEERIIRNALCFDFYEELRNQKNKIVTVVNKEQLEQEINDSLQSSIGGQIETVALEVGEIVNSSSFLNTENLLLWNEYLWKLTAETVRFVAIPQNYTSFTSQGIVHNKPIAGPLSGEGTATPDLKTAKWLMDKSLQDAIDPLIEAMHQWICKMKDKNPSWYENYCKQCDCNANGISYKRKLDIMLDIYDELDSCGCAKDLKPCGCKK